MGDRNYEKKILWEKHIEKISILKIILGIFKT